MLQLHTWGPSFGLPSIDAECLATIYYLRQVLPYNSWKLIPSNNPSLNPYQKLPALCDDSTWTVGFENIQEYLASKSGGTWDLDSDLDDVQKASCDAVKAFLFSRGLPLLDLSLYVSSENYTTCTRAALGNLLSWPQSWTVPHQIRDQAKKRSEHLGLSALDVDVAQETEDKDAGLTAKIPKSLRKPKQTVSSLLGGSVQRTRFRLDAVTEDFLEPLQAKLAKHDWLITSHVSSADHLALAILNLMQISDLPQAWLKETLATKYSRLGRWANIHMGSNIANASSATSVTNDKATDTALPWAIPAPLSWMDRSVLAIEAIVSITPGLRAGYNCYEVPQLRRGTTERPVQKQQIYENIREQQRLYAQITAACIGTTSLVGWLAHTGLLVLPRFYAVPPSRKNYGAAGAILGL